MAAGTVELAAEFGLTISHITEQGGHNKVNKQQPIISNISEDLIFIFDNIFER
jgi:hypothetical protein